MEVAEFSMFYKEAVPGLIAFLRLLGAPYAVAADCVQDTMLKALLRYGRRSRTPEPGAARHA